MTQDDLLKSAEAMHAKINRLAAIAANDRFHTSASGSKAEVAEFLKTYAGPKSSFYVEASEVGGVQSLNHLESILRSFIEYVRAGLFAEISPRRRAELDVVSDLLEQATRLLDSAGVHPAAPAMLIGATLEEYLRTWCEAVPLALGGRKPGIQTYMDLLREADLISKQDVKDLISWAGIRNHAAHGEWDQVADKQRIQLMLEGVNLFMRRHSS